MGRLLLLTAVLLVSAVGCIALGATALATEQPPLATAITESLANTPAQNSSSAAVYAAFDGLRRSGAVQESIRQDSSAHVARARVSRPGAAHADTPPRHVAGRHPARLPLLRLPKILPSRTWQVPILMYHHVSSVSPATNLNFGLTVTDENFAAQLAYLRQNGYHTVLLRQVFGAMYGGAQLPSHPIVLTFDDGYQDNYTDALPLLRRYHDVAEFNIISAYVGISVGINTYMSWGQLKSLVADGMEIGSHTVDHQDLGILTNDKVRFELRDSRNILQQRLGVPVQFLAYPSGEPFDHGSLETQQRVLALVPQYGYVGALLDGPLTSSRHDTRLPFQLWRIRVAGGEGLADFAALLQS